MFRGESDENFPLHNTNGELRMSGAVITYESNFNILVSAGLRLTSSKGGGGW